MIAEMASLTLDNFRFYFASLAFFAAILLSGCIRCVGLTRTLAIVAKDQERLAVEEGQFLLQRVARLFHLAFDELCRGIVAQQAC